MTDDDRGENNDRAVLLSEEVGFLEDIANMTSIPEDIRLLLLDRRDIVRTAMRTAPPADPSAQAEAGVTPPPTEDEMTEDTTTIDPDAPGPEDDPDEDEKGAEEAEDG